MAYSRVIGWLKIILPLMALGLLSTMFLLSRPTDQALDVPFADPDLGDRAARQQVTAPVFSTVTGRGDVITLRAQSARPEGSDQVLAEDVAVELDLSDDSRIFLEASLIRLDQTTRSATLDGGVTVTSSTGYEITTDALRAATDRIHAESLAPVSGIGPAGRFTAGKLEILGSGQDGNGRLLFTGGVKLVYDPKN